MALSDKRDVFVAETGIFPMDFGGLRRVAILSYCEALKRRPIFARLYKGGSGWNFPLFIPASPAEVGTFVAGLAQDTRLHIDDNRQTHYATFVMAQIKPSIWLPSQPFLTERLNKYEVAGLRLGHLLTPRSLDEVSQRIDAWLLTEHKIDKRAPGLAIYDSAAHDFVWVNRP